MLPRSLLLLVLGTSLLLSSQAGMAAAQALCNPANSCCIANRMLVEVSGDYVTVRTLLGGCSNYQTSTIVCSLSLGIGGACFSPLASVTKSGNTLTVAPRSLTTVSNGTCISGACLGNTNAWAGVYLVAEPGIGKLERFAQQSLSRC